LNYYFGLILGIFIYKAGGQTPALSVADSLYAVGDYTKAINTYKQLPELESLQFLNIARAYKGLGNRKQALEYYEEATIKDPNAIIGRVEYGKLLISSRKFSKGDSIFSELCNQFPENPEFHYQRGLALSGIPTPTPSKDSVDQEALQEKVRRPYNAFAKAVQLDSTHQKALYQVAKFILQKEKDFPRVEQLCFKALESAPENVEIIGLLAQSFYARGFPDDATTWFKRLIELGQSTSFIHEKLALSYRKTNFYDLAIVHFKKVLEFNDKDPYAHYQLADLYHRKRIYDKAEFHGLTALLLKDVSLEDEYYVLGLIYDKKEDYKKALKYYNLCLKEKPNNVKAAYGKVVVADKYYEDKKAVLKGYEEFLEKHGQGRHKYFYGDRVQKRISALKQELFLEEEKKD